MKKLAALSAFFAFFGLFSQTATAGRFFRGGDATALEFIQRAQTAIDTLKHNPALYPELKGVDLDATLARAQVVVTDAPLMVDVHGVKQVSVAANQSTTNEIFLNRSRWEAIGVWQIKNAVALHEILGVAKVENTGVYNVSQRYLNKLGVNCGNEICAGEIAGSTFNVMSPLSGATVSGTIHVTGQAGSQWVNTAAYIKEHKISRDFTPSNRTYSIAIDTTQLEDGPHQIGIIGFSGAAGPIEGTMSKVYLEVNVQNHPHQQLETVVGDIEPSQRRFVGQ